MQAGTPRATLLAGAFLLLVLSSFSPIQSYDAFWHLATGEWILEHRDLPATDPFALASDPVRWYNGEWLFEVAAHLIELAGGVVALSIARAIVVASLFTWLLAVVAKRSGLAAAIAVTAIAFAGADHRLGVRPELAGVVFATVVTHLLLGRLTRGKIAALGAITIVWMNMHPSALLAPVIAGATGAGKLIAGERSREEILARAASVVVAFAALLVNPWGYQGILSPLRLAAAVGSREFVNLEWLPSSPGTFPLLYVAIVAAAVLFFSRWRRELTPHLLLFALFSFLSIRYLRNQGYFFATLPLLVAPALPVIRMRALAIAAAGAGAIGLLYVPTSRGWGVGLDRERFPVAAVEQLERSGLRGNVYNPDQFGGYLIWSLWPEWGILTDGRNELHLGFLRRFDEARRDSRVWSELFSDYDLRLAVEEYSAGTMSVIDGASGTRVEVPPSLAYFPPQQWALIGFDDVAMVFARRDGWPAEELAALEYRHLLPAVPAVRVRGGDDMAGARAEIERARRAGADGERLRRMESLLESSVVR